MINTLSKAGMVAVAMFAAGAAFAQTAKPATSPNSELRSPTAPSAPTGQLAPNRDVRGPAASSADGAPLAGANSFTEGEARSRIEKNGYSDVSGLSKDSQGVWRGMAMKDGKRLNVALDYKGNVVASEQAAQAPAETRKAPAQPAARPTPAPAPVR